MNETIENQAAGGSCAPPTCSTYKLILEREGWSDETHAYPDLEGLSKMLHNPPVGTVVELKVFRSNRK